jgi:serine/threonine protein kinase
MGEVWRASHRLLRRDAAVKVMSPNAALTLEGRVVRDIRQRFEKEAQAIACLRSPHTVSLYDFGVSDEGSLYYVMELLDGLDVDQLVSRDGPQPAGRVTSLIRQACDSLEEAHDLGMVHRDIKPSNLFVCRLGKQVDFVKVLDFGLVKAVTVSLEDQRLTVEGVTQGTPPFMAPEQGLGYPDVDARAASGVLSADRPICLRGAVANGDGAGPHPEAPCAAIATIRVDDSCLAGTRRDGLPGKEARGPAAKCCRIDSLVGGTYRCAAVDARRCAALVEIHVPVPTATQQLDAVGEKRT